MIPAQDTLFLSVHAREVLHFDVPLFGRVATSIGSLTSDGILSLCGKQNAVLPEAYQAAAIICAADDHRLDVLKTQNRIPLIVVERDVIFSEGDVITISPRGRIHRLFRALSRNNAFLVTEDCNNLCVMCPQPPKPESAARHAVNEQRVVQTLDLIDDLHFPDSLCLTGGEPTILGDGLIRIVEKIKNRAPRTLIHLLTNGRALYDTTYTQRLACAGGDQLLAGIPLFGHVADIHDYVVQRQGAFEQTMAGLLNCFRYGIDVELRIVLQKDTVQHLTALAEFIAHNLFFVKHVALMGMENMGFARLNRDRVFIDPWDYRDELSQAINIFVLYGVDVRVFNLPLCVVNSDTRRYCAQSISDFKNVWHPQCARCRKREICCGFFNSTTEKYFLTHHIRPFTAE